MRVFKKYFPMLIAKYVKTFFRGRLYIHGRGGYEFERGKVLMPDEADQLHKATVQELNSKIAEITKKAA